MNGEKDLVGVIPAGQNTIAFSNKETPFSFDFMVASFLEAKDATVLKVPTVDGFLYGKTINKQDVAIYMGQTKNFEIFNTAKIQTGLYVVSSQGHNNSSIQFESIKFTGKTLNSVFMPKAPFVWYSFWHSKTPHLFTVYHTV